MEGGSEVAFGEREHQAGDAAAGAVESRHGVEGARQTEPRRAAEDEIGDADGEEQDVASENDLGACSLPGGKAACRSFCIACDIFCGKKKPPESGRLLSFRIVHDLEGFRCAAIVVDDVVERILHQGVADDAKAEEGEDEIDDGEVRVHSHAALLFRHDDGLAHLVEPVEAVDAAGDEGEEDDHAARSCRAFARCRMGVFGQCIDPIKGVDAQGDEGKNDGEGETSFCHGESSFLCEQDEKGRLAAD